MLLLNPAIVEWVPGGITHIIYFVAVSAVVVSLYATVDMRRSGVWGGTRYRCAAVHEDANWLGCGGLRSVHSRRFGEGVVGTLTLPVIIRRTPPYDGAGPASRRWTECMLSHYYRRKL
jgi:hypothetical protein